jgi:CTP synthase (UTP-ammonia lyase)
MTRLRQRKARPRIGIVGKYVELEDAYLSVKEALIHAGLALGLGIDIELDQLGRVWSGAGSGPACTIVDGIVVPGGFGYRGIEGKIVAARYAREHEDALPGALPGHAGDVHRVCPPSFGSATSQTAPSSTSAPNTRSSI